MCPYVSPEEILQTQVAHWWSPDGLRLAYMTINDTLVPRMEVPFFTGTSYPTSLDYHYPKVSLALKLKVTSFSKQNLDDLHETVKSFVLNSEGQAFLHETKVKSFSQSSI